MRVSRSRKFAIAALLALAPWAHAQTATFDNFAEGGLGANFTDPLSGIAFSDVDNGSFPKSFSADYAGPTANRPRTSPGNTLGGSFYTAGTSSYQTPQFSFTMTMPRDIDRLSMDVWQYAVPNRVLQLNLYNAGGTLVGSPTFAYPNQTLGEINVSFLRATADVRSVRVVNQVSSYTAYDNINISVPEPMDGLGMPLVVGSLVAGAAMLRRARSPQTT